MTLASPFSATPQSADSQESADGKMVIVCVEDHPKAIRLLRMARKRAEELHSQWRAVFIETPAHLTNAYDGSSERVLKLMTIAAQMGAETVHLEADNMKTGLEAMLQKEAGHVALVMIGCIGRDGAPNVASKRWRGMLLKAPWARLAKMARKYAGVELVPLSHPSYPHLRNRFIKQLSWRSVQPAFLAYALLSVMVAFVFSILIQWIFPSTSVYLSDYNAALVFMIACAFVSGRFGLAAGLVASIASFLTINFFFIPPLHSFSPVTPIDWYNLVLFLIAAVFISFFASHNWDLAKKADFRERSTQALFTLYRIGSETFSREQALFRLQEKLRHMLGMEVAFFLPPLMQPDRIDLAYPKDMQLEEADRKALEDCWAHLRTTGAASASYSGTAWRFEPMTASGGEVGVLGVKASGRARMDSWFGQLLPAIADQTATILEHIDLKTSMEYSRINEEREKLRAMLLSSVSHDLKTPLAGIIGALGVYRSLGDRLAAEKREELIEAAMDEAQRLDSFITNILDMTRLESGNIKFRQEWHSVGPMISGVAKRLQHRLRRHRLVIHPSPANVEVFMDSMLTGQVLQNVLDNAGKYTPADTLIEIICGVEPGRGFICEVRDHGKGLPPDGIERIFDKYERPHKKDLKIAGTGLGLAIGRAIIEAQGGWITAANHPEGGALFTLCLPQWRYAKTAPMQAADQKQGNQRAAVEQTYSRH